MKEIYIYTDGSHLKFSSGRLGCGGVMVDPGGEGYGEILGEFSEELTPDRMEKEFGGKTCSNPTAELVGALLAIRNFNIPKGVKVKVYADYVGVQSWMEGKWQTKEAYIREVKRQIEEEINKKGLRGRISFHWVRGHQKVTNRDTYWNNYVDALAKGEKYD